MAVLSNKISPYGLGLMGFTWRPKVTDDETAFETMKTAIEQGVVFFNGGEFYNNPDEPLANIKLIARFFKKYPEYKDRVIISIKGALNLETFAPDGSKAGIHKSIDRIIETLGPYKKLDIFEPARIDPNVSLEETFGAIEEYVKNGKIKGISISEASLKTIQKANQISPISAIEIEFSLWSTEAKENGILDEAARLNIPIVAYSPLGRGFLTGEIKSPDDIPEGDFRRTFDRFKPENFYINLQLVEKVKSLAEKKKVTSAQLALLWIKYHEKVIKGLQIIPIPGATKASRVKENFAHVPPLTQEEFDELNTILASVNIKGGRYNKHMEASLWG